MELNKKETKETVKEKPKTMDEVFNEKIKLGKYYYKLKKLKGKQLFKLFSTFGIRQATTFSMDEAKQAMAVWEEFSENFDYAMEQLQYSTDGEKFYDLVINGVFQVEEVETNVTIMSTLMQFIMSAVVLFTSISQQSLEDIK